MAGVLQVPSGGTGYTVALVGGCIIASSNSTISEVPLADGQVLIGFTGGLPFAGTLIAGTNMSVTSSSGAILVDTNIAASSKIPASLSAGNSTITVINVITYPLTHSVAANALSVNGSMIEFFYAFNYTAASATQPIYTFGGGGTTISNITVATSAVSATSGNGYMRVMMARTGAETASFRFELVYNNSTKVSRTSDENVGYNTGVGGWGAISSNLGIGFSVVSAGLPATFTLATSRITYFV
jgi:hypothetical protein